MAAGLRRADRHCRTPRFLLSESSGRNGHRGTRNLIQRVQVPRRFVKGLGLSRCNHSNLRSLPDPNDSVASASTSPPTTTEESTSAGAAAGDDPTPAPAEGVDVTVTPVFRSPEIEPPVPVRILTPPDNNASHEAKAVANGATSSSLF